MTIYVISPFEVIPRAQKFFPSLFQCKTIQQSVSEDPAMIQGLKKERKNSQNGTRAAKWQVVHSLTTNRCYCHRLFFITKGNINERSGPSFSDVSMYVSFYDQPITHLTFKGTSSWTPSLIWWGWSWWFLHDHQINIPDNQSVVSNPTQTYVESKKNSFLLLLLCFFLGGKGVILHWSLTVSHTDGIRYNPNDNGWIVVGLLSIEEWIREKNGQCWREREREEVKVREQKW